MNKLLKIIFVFKISIVNDFFATVDNKDTMIDSIAYYNQNASLVTEHYKNRGKVNEYQKFLSQLPAKSKIVDAGCGVGNDSKYFKEQGHEIVAFDASSTMVKISSEILEQPTLLLKFEDINFDNEFDGVWAYASLLHIRYENMRNIFDKIHKSLKDNGIFYCSFKYGNSKRIADNREFYDMNEELFKYYCSDLFDVLETWQTPNISDTSSPAQTWFHILCRKKAKKLVQTKQPTLKLNVQLDSEIEAIIFDLDGTLVDTEPLHYIAWKEAFASQNIDFSFEDNCLLVGNCSAKRFELLKTLKGVQNPQEILKIKREKYKQLREKGIKPIQGIVETVKKLSTRKDEFKIKLAVASAAPKTEIIESLKSVGLENCFDEIVSGSTDLSDYVDSEGINKPKPYVYLETAKRLKVSCNKCLVFEDTNAGIEAATKAGMIAIAVPNEYTLKQDFSKANKIISSIKEVFE